MSRDDEPKNSDPFGPLDFVASILYASDNPGIIRSRWWCLAEGIKETYRDKAIQTVSSWAQDELVQKRLSDGVITAPALFKK